MERVMRAVGATGASWGLLLLWRGPLLWSAFAGAAPTHGELLAIRAAS